MTVEEYNKSVDLFSDNVYRFILKNVKDKAMARDIVQDSYEKLWINHENVQFLKVKSYLFSTAYHTFIDYYRRSKKIENTDDFKQMGLSHSEQYSDLKEILDQALNQLPPDQKSVILLRDYEGYSYQEISEITGLNESQVKVYIYRARVNLKNYLISIEYVA
jgi:RNA polymerase sigma-70 factor (ECF subfamily)